MSWVFWFSLGAGLTALWFGTLVRRAWLRRAARVEQLYEEAVSDVTRGRGLVRDLEQDYVNATRQLYAANDGVRNGDPDAEENLAAAMRLHDDVTRILQSARMNLWGCEERLHTLRGMRR